MLCHFITISLISDLGLWSVELKNRLGSTLHTQTFNVFEGDPNYGEQGFLYSLSFWEALFSFKTQPFFESVFKPNLVEKGWALLKK